MAGLVPLGERLRRRRLELGDSLERISSVTKISVRLLESMESEDFDRLPGGLIRKKFVQQYATLLGFDQSEIDRELQQIRAFEEVPSIPGEDTPRLGSDMPAITPSRDWSGVRNSLASLASALVVILACAGLYMWWKNTESPTAAAPAPEIVRPSVPAPATSPVASSAAAESAPEAITPPAEAPAVSNAPIRVTLSAGEETWVSASSDGKRVYADALRPNQTKQIEAEEVVRLVIGNAGGLEIQLNGKPLGPIGSRGQVRVIEITPGGYQFVQRKTPSPESL